MELIIAEKPSVGKAIAAVVGATESRNGYMEGHGFMVTWCLGHLVELAMPEDYKRICYLALRICPSSPISGNTTYPVKAQSSSISSVP